MEISQFWNGKYKAVINQLPSGSYFIDFYYNDKFITSRNYFQNTLRYVEDAAENYIEGILKIEELQYHER